MKEITEISPGAAHRAHLGRTATFKGPTRSFPSPLPSIAVELVNAALKGLLSPALSSKGGEGDRIASPSRRGRIAGRVLAVLFTAYCAVAQDTVLSVRNISALQAIDTSTLTPNNTVLVLGYYNAGDRGGGVFQWQLNSGATPDGGRYLASSNPLSPSGRWERMLSGETANVKMWGAKGNINGGVLTPAYVAAANDDTVAIQNALNACPGWGNSGGFWAAELLFPAGFYKITSTLVAHADILKIRGESARMTSLVMPLGIQKDIFRTTVADRAIAAGDGSAGYDDNL